MSTQSDVETKINIKVPSMYKVVLLNDDYTPMDFVVAVFTQIFNKSFEEAQILTLRIHETGRGVAGIFTKEIAEMKVHDTLYAAKKNEHPLRVLLEES